MIPALINIDRLVSRLHATQDLRHCEMLGSMGMEFLEGYVHELAHLLDLDIPLDEALVTMGNNKAVAREIGQRCETADNTDHNEMVATAITTLVLDGFPCYKPEESESMMYANLRNEIHHKDLAASLFGRIRREHRTLELACEIADHLHRVYYHDL